MIYPSVLALLLFTQVRRLTVLINLGLVPRKKDDDGRAEILTIKETARLLGVSEPTLRRWDELGKFSARRHPINRYRLYDRAKVLAMRKKILGKAA